MTCTTLSAARGFIESAFGTCSTEKLTKAVNDIRQHWYNWYQEVRLFLDATECYQVERYCVDCNACTQSYSGVTLPRHAQNVEAMWLNDFPLRLQSSWREFQTGIVNECDCRLQKFDVPGTFSTAFDLIAGKPAFVVVKSTSEADIGKSFILRGRESTGAPFMQEFALTASPQRSSTRLASIERMGGIVKAATVGMVVVAEDSGRLLALVEPDETVPTYRRLKITGLPDGCSQVNIRSARRYFPVWGDNDVVETDLSIAWEAMARYLRILAKAEKSNSEFKDMEQNHELAFKLMMGQAARDEGKATNAQVQMRMPSPLSRPGLIRNSRFRRALW